MRVLITGANGFIGTHLVKYIQAQGDLVVALTRSGLIANPNTEVFQWQLGEKIPSSALVGITHAIHLAHDFNGEDGATKTYSASLDIVNQLLAAGVTRQLFFSSYSAGEHAISRYGKTKYLIEQALISLTDVTIIRPGLVLGEAGIYGRINKMVKYFPVIPLPDGGCGKVPIIEVEKLTQETYTLLTGECVCQANIFERELSSLRELVKSASKKSNKKNYIVNIPSRIILFTLRFFEYFSIKLPINSDNLQGFLANQNATHQSTLDEK